MTREQAEEIPAPKSRWLRIGAFLFLINLVCFADRTNIGVAAPSMVRDIHLSGAMTGTILSAFFWGYVVTQLPGGWLASWLGPHRVISCALIIVGLTGCLTGMVSAVPAFLAIRFTMGLAEGVVWPSCAVLFLNWFPSAERGRAVSFSQYGLPLSSVIMAPLAGWMISTFEWRTMFIFQGAPAIVLGIVFWLVASSDPATDKRISPEERQYILAHRGTPAADGGRFVDVLRLPIIWGFCATYFLWVTGMYAFGMWAPTAIHELSKDIGTGMVGWLTAIPYLFAAIAMYLVARIADRERIARGWFVTGALCLAGVGLIGQHFLGGSPVLAMTMLVATGVGIFAALGAWWSWVLGNVPHDQAGPAIGLVNLCGNFGGICGPLFVGLVAAPGHANEGLYLIGIAMFLAALLAAMLVMSGRRGSAGHLAAMGH